MADSIDTETREANKEEDSPNTGLNENLTDSKLSSQEDTSDFTKLMDLAIPTNERSQEESRINEKGLYELLDIAPKGRKLLNDIFSGPQYTGNVFQHYGRSALCKELTNKVEKWVIEDEQLSKEVVRNVASSRGDYSSAIFSWSSANRHKGRPSSSGERSAPSSRGASSSSDSRQSINTQLFKKAHAAISGLLAQQKEEERLQMKDTLARKSPSVAPSTFRADPLLKFEARALPREHKKRPKKEDKKKRSSLLWFWKGASSKDKDSKRRSHAEGAKDHFEAEHSSLGKDKNTRNVATGSGEILPETPEVLGTSSASIGSNRATSLLDSPHSDHSDADSAFGDFESSSFAPALSPPASPGMDEISSGSAPDLCDTNKSTVIAPTVQRSEDAAPLQQSAAANTTMQAFVPLEPKRRSIPSHKQLHNL